jgi:glycosyltransferase involved in cell wall biosynthesis
LLEQTYTACEFILINDGSTDSSLSIIKKYAAIDKRIILINQENKGVSEARNSGLAIAKGSYIGFVDSDDYIEKELCTNLVNAIKKYQSDVVLFNMISNIKGVDYRSKYDYPSNQLFRKDFIENELFSNLILKDDLYSCCNKLFKASIIKDNAIIFPPGDELSEDNIFNLKFFGKISSFVYIDFNGYYYREVVGSATRNIKSKDYFKNILKIYNFDYRKYLNLNFSDEKINEFKSEKLLKGVLALVNIYFTTSNQLGFFKRYAYVSEMINNNAVQNSLKKENNLVFKNSNRYNKLLLWAIKNKLTSVLFFGVQYSKLRNK